jgi:hypothetical protein
MNNNPRTWLQVYVDAVMERDPYKRLALVRELKNMPREEASAESLEEPISRRAKNKAVLRRRH